MDITKAHIDLQQGIIELEGTEEFVSKYLDEFKVNISTKNVNPIQEKNDKTETKLKAVSASVRPNRSPANRVKTKKIEPEEFELKSSDNTPSLKGFFDSKKPGETVAHRIAVIGYYITKIRKQENFSEGNIEFAYIALPLNKRPIHLRQACIDAKNRNHYLEEVKEEPGKWRLSRIGEIFVEEKLPPKPIN